MDIVWRTDTMRLWKKVSTTCILVLLFVVVTCSILLLQSAQSNLLQLTIEQTKSEQYNLKTSFIEMTNYYMNDDDTFVAKQSLINYCFSRFANETSVLVKGNETLYSQVNVSPEEVLPINEKNGQQVYLDESSGRNILVVGSNDVIKSEDYSIYVVKDITGIYNSIHTMVERFALICSVGIAVGTLFIVFLVRYATKPLIKLKETTHRIAVGEYTRRANVHSKDEIGELAQNFNEMANAIQTHITQLKDITQRQQFFIAGLTHEFKTPMTSMLIHSDTLLTANLNEDITRNSLTHINSQCRWLERLTGKLLRLITLEEDIEIKEESVEYLFNDVRQSMTEIMKERNTPIVVECNTDTLMFDYDLMKSLLINLVDNASKASKPNQSITLRAYNKTLEVEDFGEGIPKEKIKHITDPFYMVDRSRSKLKSGSGLGLALVKRIAEAHGIKLAFESEIGVGTLIRIIFS